MPEVVAELPVVEVVHAARGRAARIQTPRIARSRPRSERREATARACPRRYHRPVARAVPRRTTCRVRSSGGIATGAQDRSASAARTSARASSAVCPGSAYIRSRLKLASPAACSSSAARRVSSAEWMRPSSLSCRASKLCAPSETRVMPAARYSANLPRSMVPGIRLERDFDRGREAELRARVVEQPADRRR